MRDVVNFSSKDGLYINTLAKSLMVSLYSEWDELYRHRLATGIGVEAAAIRADLMGDLRHVRNWIVHNKSVVGKNQLKVLPWHESAGSILAVSEERFAQFMDKLNEMEVYVVGA